MSEKGALSVNDIRPFSLLERQNQALANDQKWIETQRHRFEKGFCPLCSTSTGSVTYTTPASHVYKRCPECETLYLDPRPSSPVYAEYYRISESMSVFANHVFPQSQERRIKDIYEPRLARMLRYVTRHARGSGAYLEIGAGSGVFASRVKQSGAFSDVRVVEPAPDLAANCRSRGLTTLEKSIEEVDEVFEDVGTMACFELLEHLVDPVAFLKKAHSLLRSGGLFFATTPNGLGFDVLELGGRSSTLGFTHVHLFNPESIRRLFQTCGFEVLDVSTPGLLDVDIVYQEYSKPNSQPPDSWFGHVLLNGSQSFRNSLQEFLVANNQSTHMWIAARKE